MDAKLKQQWLEEETQCFLALWSSEEVQAKLKGASRNKPIFEKIQREMASAGYERTVDQLLNKLKKLRKEFRDQKRELGRSGTGRTKKGPHFDVLDSVLGDRPANKVTGAPNSATAAMGPEPESFVAIDDPEFSPVDFGALSQRSVSRDDSCNSPAPSCSTPVPPSSPSASSSSSRLKPGKRKRTSSHSELLQYLKETDEQYMECYRQDQELFTAMFHSQRQTDEAMLGLMGRMVSLLEEQAKKQ